MGLFFGALAAVAVFLMIHPLRDNLSSSIHGGPLVIETVLLVLSAALISAAAVSLGFPGRSSQRPLVVLGASAVAVLLGYLLFSNFSEGIIPPEPEHVCGEIVLGLSLLPSLLGVWLTRKLVPVHPRLSAVCIGLFSVLLAAASLAYVCPNDHRSHLMIWHLGIPGLILSLVALPLASRLLRW